MLPQLGPQLRRDERETAEESGAARLRVQFICGTYNGSVVSTSVDL